MCVFWDGHYIVVCSWVIGSGVTVAPPAQQGVAADEDGHPHPAQSGQNVLIDHTQKTHPHALLTKIPLDPATKSPLRGKISHGCGHYH